MLHRNKAPHRLIVPKREPRHGAGNAGAPARMFSMTTLDPALAASPQDRLRHALELIGFSLALAYGVFLVGSAFERVWLIDGLGRIIDNDFIAVWAAGRLVLDGHPAAAYDWDLHRQVEVAVAGRDFASYYGWHYPPTFLFAAAALATLPYLAAWALWMAVTLPAYVAVVRAIIGERIGIVLALGFPAVLWNISVGQNGFLTAALIGGTLVFLERRPLLAGLCLGLLTYKPQFGLLFPVILLLDGRWRVLAAASVTAAALVAASVIAFGMESWQAFFAWMPVTSNAVFAEGRANLMKMQSLLGLVRWLGGSVTAAWLAQAVLIAGATVALAWLWRQRVRYEIKAAALATGALLATPYLYIYDFPVLAIPLAFLMRMGLRDGFLAFELPGIALACGLILAFPVVAMPTGFAAAVVVAALVARRAAATHAATRAALRETAPA
jgi:arabinofuranan 3-O-arabinosyltransferase